jgi:hypothetical protein
VANEITDSRAEAARRARRTRQALEPYGGQPLPGWLGGTLHEVRVFLGFVWEQLSKKFFLRAPAIAGLLVGWWLGRSFSSSEAATWVHHTSELDVRDRGEVETKARLAFWCRCSPRGAVLVHRVVRRAARAAQVRARHRAREVNCRTEAASFVHAIAAGGEGAIRKDAAIAWTKEVPPNVTAARARPSRLRAGREERCRRAPCGCRARSSRGSGAPA